MRDIKLNETINLNLKYFNGVENNCQWLPSRATRSTTHSLDKGHVKLEQLLT